ncbi:uncharacterized protein TNCV_1233241 [Trichonephila clavipes]|nr:uncharacterized protein TNCV_1233241 [Trichonephila clavipes]
MSFRGVVWQLGETELSYLRLPLTEVPNDSPPVALECHVPPSNIREGTASRGRSWSVGILEAQFGVIEEGRTLCTNGTFPSKEASLHSYPWSGNDRRFSPEGMLSQNSQTSSLDTIWIVLGKCASRKESNILIDDTFNYSVSLQCLVKMNRTLTGPEHHFLDLPGSPSHLRIRCVYCPFSDCNKKLIVALFVNKLEYLLPTRGLLATDHVILNHGQMTWTTPELALPLLTTTPHQREDFSALGRFNVHRCPTRRVFSDTGLEHVTRQATIRYPYHSATAAPCRESKSSRWCS